MLERELTFVTSNKNKLFQVREILGNQIIHDETPLTEIQSFYLGDIVERKAKDASEILKRPVIVEDTSLSINALNGLPGPFVRHFLEKIGVEGILKMMNGIQDRTSWVEVMFGYHDGKNVHLFKGVERGEISKYPKGKNGFGWDSIFIPAGYTQTRAEMEIKDFNDTNPRLRALLALKKHLQP